MKRRLAVVTALVAALLGLGATAASAHPLGNFTVNTFSGLVVAPDRLRVDYLIDMAEIPTFQARESIDTNHDGRLAPGELAAYGARECAALLPGLRASAGNTPLRLTAGRATATLPPGQAGLPTLRLQCPYAAPLQLGNGTAIRYTDGNFAGRVGWHEISAVGDRATLTASNVPSTSISRRLTAYPKDLLSSPLDVRRAAVTARPGGSALVGNGDDQLHKVLPRGVDAATTAFLGFVGRAHLDLALGLAAVALAMLLGALHALAPGHGKTVMAAYLVGRRGSLRTAVTIGLTVTLTHTAGVLVLGIALSLSTAFAPERLFPVMGVVSGLLLAGIGVSLLVGALRRRGLDETGHGHGHPHPHDHGAHGHDHHEHEHEHEAHGVHVRPVDDGPRRRGLVAVGFAGGLVPSPSALVVLLGAIALHRAWLGIVLVTAYGAGMAATLTLAGLLLVRARGALERRVRIPAVPALLSRGLPIGTAGIITLVGAVLAVRGLAATGWA